jgi:outer membrane biosynthesis protein TonB
MNIMLNQLRLDDLLARDVIPRWFEGVAVVQLICRQLRAQGTAISGFPRAGDIRIGPGGSIAITGEGVGNPIQAAAHVLALMLSEDAPVRLRLAVSQATATESGYASLMEFSEALAYFERPNPEAIADAFRQRAMEAPPRDVTPPVRIDAPPVSEKQSAPVAAPAQRRGSRLPVIAATISALVCASVWLIGGSVTHVSAPDVVIAERAEPAAAATRPGAAAARTHPDTPAPKVSVTRTSTPRAESTPGARAAALEAMPQLQVIAESVSYRYPELLSPRPEREAEPGQTGSTSASSSTGAALTEERSERIYSRADSEVRVPTNIYPRFPTQPAAVPVTGRTILELTIATDGLVERVKMLTAPRNIHEFMLLSAAKAWRFEPATLGGRPVRFRHTMALIPMP